MRKLAAVSVLSIFLAVALAGPASASVSRTEDYLSLATRTYPVVPTEVVNKSITAGTGEGYWLVASDGGVFAFGDATFAGSAAGITSHAIVGMAKTKTGKGYWLAASDGGVFAFGDAQFYGSVPGLNPPADGTHVFSGITAAADGNGYYLYDRHAHVYTFGSAQWYGSPAGWTQDRPVTGLAVTPSGNGYYMTDIRCSLWAYGDAEGNYIDYAPSPWGTHGCAQLSAVSAKNVYTQTLDGKVIPGYYNVGAPAYGAKATADYRLTAFANTAAGYWQVAMDGSVFAIGDAPFRGSLPQFVSTRDLVAPIVGMARSGPS